MKKNIAIAGFLAAAFAVITQWIISMSKATGPEDGMVAATVRYYSYMTVWTNILVALCFGSVALFPNTAIGKLVSGKSLQSATVVYILIVGLAYHFLLAGTFHPQGLEYFADLLLHYINPVLYASFWFAFCDKERFDYGNALRWLWWPGAYFIYSLVKGFLTDWYPYYFVDVVKLGYPQVLTTSAILMAGYALMGLVVIALSRRMSAQAVG